MWNRLLLLMLLPCCAGSSASYRDVESDFEVTARRPAVPLPDDRGLLEDLPVLDPDRLVELVLERNSSIEMARQGWRQALALHSEATAFADPRLALTVAPLSFGSDVRTGVGAELSQPLPFPGKRRLRGEIVIAEAEAARADFRAVKSRLVLMTKNLYYDYYVVHRGLDINREHAALLESYRTFVTRYLETGRAWQEDALKVDVGLADLQRQRTSLEAQRDDIVNQLNALLHRNPRAELPPPPLDLVAPAGLSASRDELSKRALAQRPELQATASKLRGADAEIGLARKDSYPDYRLVGQYSRMWATIEHQVTIGVSFDLPVQRASRDGKVSRAQAAAQRTRAENAHVAHEVLRDVETAVRRIEESDDNVVLYRDRLLPAAQNRVAAIRIGLDAGRTSFIEIIRAERELRTEQLHYHEMLANSLRHRAMLDWAIGDVPGEPDQGGQR